MANLVLQNNTKAKSTDITLKVNGSSDWKISNNNGTFIINSTNNLLSIDTSGNVRIYKGHLFLDGANTNSAANTTQLVFRQTQSDGSMLEHIALSSNDDAFVINPASNSTTGQIVFYLGTNTNRTSVLPSNLQIDKSLTVTGDITASGKFAVSATNKGYYLVDSTKYAYPGIYDNGSNLWIGSTQTAAKHHTGSTYISSGYNGSNGNQSIYVSIPNTTNDNGTNYKVFHEGFLNVGKTTTGILKIENGGTNSSTRRGAAHNLLFLGTNIVDTTANDTGNFWSTQGFGIAYTNADITKETYARPYNYMHILNIARNEYNLINQIGFSAGSGLMVIRGGSMKDGMGDWKGVVTTTTISTATGSATIPVYVNSSGNIVACSTYAGGSKVTLNGTNKGASEASFYAPTGAGTSGYILKSNGSGAPTWIQTLPVAHGGTGHTSWTKNRLVWTSDTDTLTGGNHWVDADHVGINMTSAPDTALGVNGSIKATNTIQTGGNSHRAYLYFTPTGTSMSTGYIRIINGSSGDSAISNSYFALIQNSYTSGTNTVLEKTETFRLPSTSAGLTENKTYSILTSKETVTVAQGGTGKTTRIDAANYLLNGLDTGSSTPVDADYYISQYVGGGTTTTTYHRRPMSALWAYVKGKMSVSNNGPTLAWGTTSTVGTVAGTALKVTMPANPNTDKKVEQARTTATNWRPILMHYENGSYNSDPGSATNAVYYNEKIAISPSDGHIRTSGYVNCGAVIIGKNNDAAGHTYTGYGTAKPKGNVTAILGRVYFQLV